MKALRCHAHGAPEDLIVEDVPLPSPGPGEVRIRVAAAGVNLPDALIIQNLYQLQPPLPFTPGGEAAGWIDAIGEGVTGVSLGDRVAAMTLAGAFAEHVVVAADRLIAVPDGVPLGVAAAMTMAHGTAYHALAQRAAVQPGETVLVLGASGGVGLASVEVAKAMGARVIAAASAPDRLALARERGADVLVDYEAGDLRTALREAQGTAGIDVIVDPVGGSLAEPAFRSIGRNGRYLVVGFAAGTIPAIPLNLPLLKAASIVGVLWGAFTVREPEQHRANMATLYAWLLDGRLQPLISRRFPLADAAQAIRLMMDRKAAGKIVIDVCADGPDRRP
ncbi:NADPH:quinone oxidoreductase family protein [Sphingomonas jatrophae]|uniref:NADPH2:quinone reductase n=1 Tax=Sphingomonas jatrophae TaxID=1166337 RepID=A0A1I6KCI4_9SPHN|nr:NADPH:quinone oxidoreductase family protein [Sphingomonas jatrophae]SFR88927.1 NADPH2:quinone reductase [Sphingomonas jatrophae]